MKTILLFVLFLSASSMFAQEEPEPYARPLIPWGVWLAVGSDGDALGLSAGIRRATFGLGVGYTRDISLDLPAYSSAAPPEGINEELIYDVESLGLDLYMYFYLTQWLALYGSAGGYLDVNMLLLRDADGAYYESPNSPNWTNGHLAWGFGVDMTVASFLIVGAGYHAELGVNAHVGYAW